MGKEVFPCLFFCLFLFCLILFFTCLFLTFIHYMNVELNLKPKSKHSAISVILLPVPKVFFMRNNSVIVLVHVYNI